MKKILFAVLFLGLAMPVMAQEGGDDGPQGPPPAMVAAHNQIVRFLELSEEQVAAWDDAFILHRESEQPIQDAIRDVQGELETLLSNGNADPAEVGDLVIERYGLGEDLREIHRVYHDTVLSILDEDQAGRLGFIAEADRAQRFIPAFKAFELIPRD